MWRHGIYGVNVEQLAPYFREIAWWKSSSSGIAAGNEGEIGVSGAVMVYSDIQKAVGVGENAI